MFIAGITRRARRLRQEKTQARLSPRASNTERCFPSEGYQRYGRSVNVERLAGLEREVAECGGAFIDRARPGARRPGLRGDRHQLLARS